MSATADTADLVRDLRDLFTQIRDAHHAAFAATDGAHPDWPLWYAEHAHERLARLLDAKLTQSELVYLLVLVSKEQALHAPGAEWTAYYARWFAARYR
jgi:hypothetical protein